MKRTDRTGAPRGRIGLAVEGVSAADQARIHYAFQVFLASVPRPLVAVVHIGAPELFDLIDREDADAKSTH